MKKNFLLFFLLLLLSGISCKNDSLKIQKIFNGKDMKGWRLAGNGEGFRVSDGNLVCGGTNSYLFLNGGNFINFLLEAEVLVEPGASSAIFFHTLFQEKGDHLKGYEVKIGNSTSISKTGSITGIRNINFPFVGDNEWFRIKVTVIENHIEVFLNDVKVNDYVQPDQPWRSKSALERLIGNGTIALRATEKNDKVLFRSLNLSRLAEGAKVIPPVSSEWDELVTKLMDKDFPLVDYHVHLKGGLTVEQAVANSQKLGINYGIAPNCGLHFPVTNDSSLYAYMKEVEGKPIFKGMQAEGREWITLFSPAAVSKFDYVFTDAMTFTDSKGRRNRIWIPEEVWIEDKEKFMDMLVGKIEAIFSQEPVDIYVNPTVLPTTLMKEYDNLWTKHRLARVIKVLAENNVALEINARYRVPKPEMIIMAKKAGIKFSFGTNNTGNELGHLEYCLKMIEECNLTPDDIFVPKSEIYKPINVKGLPNKITG